MRLLFLNRSFWPDVEATGQLLTELCVDLAANHDVTVVAGPSYHVQAPGRGFWQRDAIGAVRIVRTWGTRLPKQHMAGRLLNLGSYYALAAAATLRLARPDVLIVQTDPPLLGVLGAALKARWGCRFVYYCQDVYPDVAEVTDAVWSRGVRTLLARANRLAYRAADLIIVPGHDMAKRLRDKGVRAEKLAVLPNWVDCDVIKSGLRGSFRTQFGDKFVVMYSGNLGLSQQLETVIESAQLLRHDARVLFVFIGEGARKTWLQERARRAGLENVRFLPYQAKEQLGDSLGAADLHLVPLRAGLTGCLVPSKVYGILAAGRPFVTVMDENAEIAALARQHRVGFVCPPGDAAALAHVISDALARPLELQAMGRRGRELAEREYHRPLLTRRFAALVETLHAQST